MRRVLVSLGCGLVLSATSLAASTSHCLSPPAASAAWSPAQRRLATWHAACVLSADVSAVVGAPLPVMDFGRAVDVGFDVLDANADGVLDAAERVTAVAAVSATNVFRFALAVSWVWRTEVRPWLAAVGAALRRPGGIEYLCASFDDSVAASVARSLDDLGVSGSLLCVGELRSCDGDITSRVKAAAHTVCADARLRTVSLSYGLEEALGHLDASIDTLARARTWNLMHDLAAHTGGVLTAAQIIHIIAEVLRDAPRAAS